MSNNILLWSSQSDCCKGWLHDMDLLRAFPFFSMFFVRFTFLFQKQAIGHIGVISAESVINLPAYEQRVEQIQLLSFANREAVVNMWVPKVDRKSRLCISNNSSTQLYTKFQ